MKILISPYSQKLPEKKRNPKDFPYWEKTVSLIKNKLSYSEIIQVGTNEEIPIKGITSLAHNYTPENLLKLTKSCNAWLSVDNFFQHFCTYYNIPNGIVIFGQSDPDIFGYSSNTNLLKNRNYLRQDQFLHWWHESVRYNEEVFVSAETVAETLFKVLKVD